MNPARFLRRIISWSLALAWLATTGGIGPRLRRWRRSRRMAALRQGEDPYVVGAVVQDPDKFYGRQETLDAILTALAHDNHLAIYGERRIGKTSLLYQVAHRLRVESSLERWFIPVIVSLQMVAEERFFHALMSEVARTARPFVGDVSFLPVRRAPA